MGAGAALGPGGSAKQLSAGAVTLFTGIAVRPAKFLAPPSDS
jgi:hypothetical protein